MTTKSLLEATYELMALVDKRWPRHTIATEAELDLNWLNSFAQKRIHNPGVLRTQKLHDFLLVKVKEKRPEWKAATPKATQPKKKRASRIKQTCPHCKQRRGQGRATLTSG